MYLDSQGEEKRFGFGKMGSSVDVTAGFIGLPVEIAWACEQTKPWKIADQDELSIHDYKWVIKQFAKLSSMDINRRAQKHASLFLTIARYGPCLLDKFGVQLRGLFWMEVGYTRPSQAVPN